MESLLAAAYLVFAALFWPILSYDWPLLFHDGCHCLVMIYIAYCWLLSPYHGFRLSITSSRSTSLLLLLPYLNDCFYLIITDHRLYRPLLSHPWRLLLDNGYCSWLLSLILLDRYRGSYAFIRSWNCSPIATLHTRTWHPYRHSFINENYLSPTYVVRTCDLITCPLSEF